MAVRSAAFVVLALVIAPADAALPPGLSPREAACERAFGPATDAFGAAIALCHAHCDLRADGGNFYRHICPYAGSTLDCIDRARAIVERRIKRACRRDCPECYAGGDCSTYREAALDVTRVVVTGLLDQALCDDTFNAVRMTLEEARCRRAAVRSAAKAARALGECYVRCRRRSERGDAALDTCASSIDPPATVSACVTRVMDRARREIDRRCVDTPECFPQPTRLLDAVAEQIRSDYDVLIFCSSPSGAFVEPE